MSSSTQLEKNTKKCSFCAEEIHVEAIKCKHCGSSLAQRSSNNGSKRSLLFSLTWVGVFVGCFLVVMVFLTIGDYFIFGRLGDSDNPFNYVSGWIIIVVCGVIAQKTAKKYVRKVSSVSFFDWWHPDLSDQKKRKNVIWLSACVLGINALVWITTLMQLMMIAQSTVSGSAIFLVVLAIGLYVASAFFIRKMSRIASIVGLSLFSLETLLQINVLILLRFNQISIPDNQINTATWLVRILFLIFLINGVRATFAENVTGRKTSSMASK